MGRTGVVNDYLLSDYGAADVYKSCLYPRLKPWFRPNSDCAEGDSLTDLPLSYSSI